MKVKAPTSSGVEDFQNLTCAQRGPVGGPDAEPLPQTIVSGFMSQISLDFSRVISCLRGLGRV